MNTWRLINEYIKRFATVTLVGGTGNTTPVYTTNRGRYATVGNICFVDVYLTGDGGNEGAGSGQVNIALPVNASDSKLGSIIAYGGSYTNSTSLGILYITIAASASTCALVYQTNATSRSNFTGAQQNNATRAITLSFHYEI